MPRRGDNIRKRTDGRWEGRYRYRTDSGLYKYKSIYGRAYGEVKEKLATVAQSGAFIPINYAVSSGGAVCVKGRETNNMKFCEVMEKWLSHIEQTRKHSTYMKYLSVCEGHIKDNLVTANISDITNRYVKEKIFSDGNGKIISSSMKHSILAIVNQILKYATEYYDCPAVKLTNSGIKEKNKTAEFITRTEQARLLSYLYKDMDVSKAGIILCISTGLRLGEICSLKWEDIDLNQLLIHVNRTVQRIAVKNKDTKTILMETPPKSMFSQREIPLSDSICRLLTNIKADGRGYVLCGDKPMEPRTYQNHFKKYLKEALIKDYNFHALRHTFATNCIDYGMDVKSLSEILGHSDVQLTLNRYVHPTMDTKRKHINTLSSVYGQYCGQTFMTYE